MLILEGGGQHAHRVTLIGAATASNGKIYAIGGQNQSGALATVEEV